MWHAWGREEMHTGLWVNLKEPPRRLRRGWE